jgi:hypothetical protein
MTELQGKWIKAIEDYYRDSYPASMRKKVMEILPAGEATLQALYDTIIRSVSAQYRTVPDVIALQHAMNEVAEAYPELSAPQVPLLADAPINSDLSEWFTAWKDAIKAGENPLHSERVRAVLRKHGAEGMLDPMEGAE